jgi:prepilin-type N-terminal cleavage/methylation domain-containing protein
MKHTRLGFSMLEVMVSISIFSFIVVAMLEFTSRTFQSVFSLNDRSATVAQGRETLDLLSRELREARPGATGAYPLATTTNNEIIFFANVDASSDIERVRYTLTGSTILRGIIKPTGSPATYPVISEVTTIVVRDVVNGVLPAFAYYNGSYTGSQTALATPVTPTAVRYVTFTVRLDENVNKKPGPIEIKSSAALRNIKDNL